VDRGPTGSSDGGELQMAKQEGDTTNFVDAKICFVIKARKNVPNFVHLASNLQQLLRPNSSCLVVSYVFLRSAEFTGGNKNLHIFTLNHVGIDHIGLVINKAASTLRETLIRN
jgi:hypothetical protein